MASLKPRFQPAKSRVARAWQPSKHPWQSGNLTLVPCLTLTSTTHWFLIREPSWCLLLFSPSPVIDDFMLKIHLIHCQAYAFWQIHLLHTGVALQHGTCSAYGTEITCCFLLHWHMGCILINTSFRASLQWLHQQNSTKFPGWILWKYWSGHQNLCVCEWLRGGEKERVWYWQSLDWTVVFILNSAIAGAWQQQYCWHFSHEDEWAVLAQLSRRVHQIQLVYCRKGHLRLLSNDLKQTRTLCGSRTRIMLWRTEITTPLPLQLPAAAP